MLWWAAATIQDVAVNELRQIVPDCPQIGVGHLGIFVDAENAPFVNGQLLFGGVKGDGHQQGGQ